MGKGERKGPKKKRRCEREEEREEGVRREAVLADAGAGGCGGFAEGVGWV